MQPKNSPKANTFSFKKGIIQIQMLVGPLPLWVMGGGISANFALLSDGWWVISDQLQVIIVAPLSYQINFDFAQFTFFGVSENLFWRKGKGYSSRESLLL